MSPVDVQGSDLEETIMYSVSHQFLDVCEVFDEQQQEILCYWHWKLLVQLAEGWEADVSCEVPSTVLNVLVGLCFSSGMKSLEWPF